MRGNRKQHTLRKLDRTRTLPPYLSKRQAKLYEQDIYKYLIHLLKIFPTDEFHVVQFLLLQFHPLILRVCRKFNAKNIQLDWMDLVSFARYCFVELLYRFDLNSTLYFRTFIPLALDRAINDYLMYDLRRKALFNSVRLDQLTVGEKDTVLKEHSEISGYENSDTSNEALKAYKDECIHYVEKHTEIAIEDKDIFLEHFLRGVDLSTIAKQKRLPLHLVRKKLSLVLEEVKQHLKENFI